MYKEDIIEWYKDNYCIIKEITFGSKNEDKMYIGNKNNRVCRFCNKKEPETTFKKIAHAVPEAIGNHSYLSYEECDKCNKYFNKLESALCDFLGKFRTISRIEGKNGIPIYDSTNIKLEYNEKENTFYCYAKIKNIIIDNKEIVLSSKHKYIPRNLFKCLVKMALSLLDNKELEYFKKTIEWLRTNKYDNILNKNSFITYITFYNKPPFRDTHHIFFKRKDDTKLVPYITYFIAFSNFSFQIFIPSFEMKNSQYKILPYEIIDDEGIFYGFCAPCLSSKKVEELETSIKISYK